MHACSVKWAKLNGDECDAHLTRDVSYANKVHLQRRAPGLRQRLSMPCRLSENAYALTMMLDLLVHHWDAATQAMLLIWMRRHFALLAELL